MKPVLKQKNFFQAAHNKWKMDCTDGEKIWKGMKHADNSV